MVNKRNDSHGKSLENDNSSTKEIKGPSLKNELQIGKDLSGSGLVPRETVSPLMQAVMDAAKQATNWEKQSNASEKDASLGPLPPAGKVTLGRRKLEKIFSFRKKFAKHKANYVEHVGEGFEERARKQKHFRWIDGLLQKAHADLADYVNLQELADPANQKYKTLSDAAAQKKLGTQINPKGEKYKPLGEYMQATRNLIEFKKEVEALELQWQEAVNLERKQIAADHQWLTDNLHPVGFDGKSKEELQEVYNGIHNKATKTLDTLKMAPRLQRETQIDGYDSIKSTLEDLKLDRKVQDDMWDNTIAKVITRLDNQNNRSYAYMERYINDLDDNSAQNISNTYGNTLEGYLGEKDSEHPTTPSERKEKIRALEQFADNLDSLADHVGNLKLELEGMQIAADYQWLTDNLPSAGFDGKPQEALLGEYNKIHNQAIEALDTMSKVPRDQREELWNMYDIKPKIEDMKLDRKVQGDMWNNTIAEVLNELDGQVEQADKDIKRYNIGGFEDHSEEGIDKIRENLLQRYEGEKNSNHPIAPAERKKKVKALEETADKLDGIADELETKHASQKLELERKQIAADYQWLTDNLPSAGFDGKSQEALQGEYNKIHNQATKTLDAMSEVPRDQREELWDTYDDIKSKLEDMKLDRKVQDDMWANTHKEAGEQVDSVIDAVDYNCRFGFNDKTAEELKKDFVKILEDYHKKTQRRKTDTAPARKAKIKSLEKFTNNLKEQGKTLGNYADQIVGRIGREDHRFGKAYKSIEQYKEDSVLGEQKKQEIEELCKKYLGAKGQAKSEDPSILPSQREQYIKDLEKTADKLNDIADKLAIQL